MLLTFVVASCDRPELPDEVTIDAALPSDAARADRPLAGFALGMFYKSTDADYEALLWEAARVGATTVNIVVMWEQQDISDSSIERSSRHTPTDETVLRLIRAADAMGIDVMLMPVVHVRQRARGEWRGTLEPEDLDAWWSTYEGFVEHYAELAAGERVTWFSVGSELGSRQGDVSQWTSLIGRVRALTDAQLTYSANWDRFEQVPFWSQLDAVGVSLYESLPVADDRELRLSAARGVRRNIEAYASSLGLPIVVTEFGFPSRRSAARRPWDSAGAGAVDLELQAELTEMVLTTWCESEQLAAIYIWNYYGVGGGYETGYAVRGKPALNTLLRPHACNRRSQ